MQLESLTILLAVASLVAMIVLGAIPIRRSIRNDKQAQVDKVDQRVQSAVQDARMDERRNCEQRVDGLRTQIATITADRDYQRSRADGLQERLNDRAR